MVSSLVLFVSKEGEAGFVALSFCTPSEVPFVTLNAPSFEEYNTFSPGAPMLTSNPKQDLVFSRAVLEALLL